MSIRRLVGRCANGAERDGGIRWHYVEGYRYPDFMRALCGAEPGRRTPGWSSDEGIQITCPKCLKRAAALNHVCEVMK